MSLLCDLLNAANCLNVTCNPQPLAAYDLQQWAKSLNTLLPGDTATVICVPPALTKALSRMTADRWSQLCTAHDAEIWLIKARLERTEGASGQPA